MSERREKEKSETRTSIIIATVLVVSVIGGWLVKKYVYDAKPEADVSLSLDDDPICKSMGTFKLKCVVGLAGEGVLGPGHFVSYPAQAPTNTRVPFPDGDLFSQSCLVPGEQADSLLAALRGQERDQNSVTVGDFTYKLNRSFRAGADLPIPRLPELVLKAGPQLSEIKEIGMRVPDARLKIIDLNQFLDLLDNSGLRKKCIDRLISAEYQVVSKALVGSGVVINFTDKQGKSIDLSAAATGKQVAVSGGAGANVSVDQSIARASSTPVVLGVDFFPPNIFGGRPKLTEPVVYAPSGQATFTVTGNGGEGTLQERKETRNLGGTILLYAQGGESSECQGEVQRTKSFAQATVSLQAPTAETLRFSAQGEIGGGHYATGHCNPFGGLIVEAGHDNGVSAVYTFSGYIRATVRSDDIRMLAVQFSGLPDNSNIEVRDPNGQLLNLSEERTAAPVQGTGNLEFLLRGAGVYITQVSATYQSSVNGAGKKELGEIATVSLSAR